MASRQPHLRREIAEVALALPIDLTFDLTGTQYARDRALARFYFHVMTAYANPRHRGVALCKAEYVGHMFVHLRSTRDG